MPKNMLVKHICFFWKMLWRQQKVRGYGKEQTWLYYLAFIYCCLTLLRRFNKQWISDKVD